jgi:hypothetical protein
MQTFATDHPYVVEIPESVLKGNPLRWGYQAIVTNGSGRIEDIIAEDDVRRTRSLSQAPVCLQAIRPQRLVDMPHAPKTVTP